MMHCLTMGQVMTSVLAQEAMLGEPSLDELFQEPIIRLIMQRDGVEENQMRGQIDRVLASYRSLSEPQ